MDRETIIANIIALALAWEQRPDATKAEEQSRNILRLAVENLRLYDEATHA